MWDARRFAANVVTLGLPFGVVLYLFLALFGGVLPLVLWGTLPSFLDSGYEWLVHALRIVVGGGIFFGVLMAAFVYVQGRKFAA